MSQWVGVAVLACAALAAGVFFGGKPAPPPSVSFTPATATESATVHVTGAVASPGLVSVATPARVADAVAAAGGLTADAVTTALNLAAPVRDGAQIVVPRTDSGSAGTGLISLSSAPVGDLTSLPGVGPVLAERIVEYRERNGPFQSLEDLLSVPGIGESKLAALRDVAMP